MQGNMNIHEPEKNMDKVGSSRQTLRQKGTDI